VPFHSRGLCGDSRDKTRALIVDFEFSYWKNPADGSIRGIFHIGSWASAESVPNSLGWGLHPHPCDGQGFNPCPNQEKVRISIILRARRGRTTDEEIVDQVYYIGNINP
jgi:hypothetical protein